MWEGGLNICFGRTGRCQGGSHTHAQIRVHHTVMLTSESRKQGSWAIAH